MATREELAEGFRGRAERAAGRATALGLMADESDQDRRDAETVADMLSGEIPQETVDAALLLRGAGFWCADDSDDEDRMEVYLYHPNGEAAGGGDYWQAWEDAGERGWLDLVPDAADRQDVEELLPLLQRLTETAERWYRDAVARLDAPPPHA